ncbi:MAG: hypothetical protein IPK53_12440 [bacterium]|nr:hypothetical protein [bacterium]
MALVYLPAQCPAHKAGQQRRLAVRDVARRRHLVYQQPQEEGVGKQLQPPIILAQRVHTSPLPSARYRCRNASICVGVSGSTRTWRTGTVSPLNGAL